MIDLWKDHANTRGVVVMMRLAKMRLKADRSPVPFYRAAGQHLARLRYGRTKDKWRKIVRDECGLGLSRAYELIAISGNIPPEQLRAQAARRKSRWRTKAKAVKALRPKQNYIDARLEKLRQKLDREQKMQMKSMVKINNG